MNEVGEEAAETEREASGRLLSSFTGHATTFTTLSTQNLHHMLQWLCNPISGKDPRVLSSEGK